MMNNVVVLWTLVGVLAMCFVAESAYRRITGRSLAARSPSEGGGALAGSKTGSKNQERI